MRLVDRSLTQLPCSGDYPDYTPDAIYQGPVTFPHEKGMKHAVQKGTYGVCT